MTAPSLDITEYELRGMTRDLEQLHHDTRGRFLDSIADLGDALHGQVERAASLRHTAATRRNFLRGGLVTAGALGGGLVVAACGSSSSASNSTSMSSTAGASTDLAVARLAASLEVLAVSTYGAALMGAAKGSFGTVPPAIGNFAQTAMMQHQDHQNAWNAALKAAGQQAQTTPDPKYKAVVDRALPGLKTIVDVANLALTLETVAVETYVKGAQLVTVKANRQVALTIAPVEAQHIAVLNYVLGKYPVPATTIATDMAASPADLG